MSAKYIHPFSFGDRNQSDLLGGKGANLAEMVKIGLPVPPGFTITTLACREFLRTGEIPSLLPEELEAALINLEKELGKKFGDPKNPLLVSVRSGAKFSMPGDGNSAKCWDDARSCGGVSATDRKSKICLGLLPKVCGYVWPHCL